MKRRQELQIFNMSFLDCISCGFGATVLVFMLMKHSAPVPDAAASVTQAQVSGEEDKLLDDRHKLLVLRAALEDSEKAQQLASKEAERLSKKIEDARSAMLQKDPGNEDGRARVLILENDLKVLESKVKAMRAAAADAGKDAVLQTSGEARREYLSGLSVEGNRILILVDTSASMLAETIVEAIRRRNMDDATKTASTKWRRSVAAVEWIAAQMPASGQFQIYGFNDTAKPALADSAGKWLPNRGDKLAAAVKAIRLTAPGGGTSLANAFAVISSLNPAPDHVYLVTDGLPTTDRGGSSGLASGKDRVRYFNSATARLPNNLPISVVLMPMEGDPKAAAAYWELARNTGGSYFNPSADWP